MRALVVAKVLLVLDVPEFQPDQPIQEMKEMPMMQDVIF